MPYVGKGWHSANAKWISVSIFVILMDQTAKWFARKNLLSYSAVKILPWLNFKLAFNTGVAFSLLNNGSGFLPWALIGLIILISGYLLIWIFQAEPAKKILLLALTLILGGAISNLIDRIWLGYVTDFIDFHIHAWHFATFNLADSAVSIGAVMLAYLLLVKQEF